MKNFILISTFFVFNLCFVNASETYFKKERLIVERSSSGSDLLATSLPIATYTREWKEIWVYGPHPSCGMQPIQHCQWINGQYVCWTEWVERWCNHYENSWVEKIVDPNYAQINFKIHFDPKAQLDEGEKESFQLSYDHSKRTAYVLIKKSKYQYEKKDYGLGGVELNDTANFKLNLK